MKVNVAMPQPALFIRIGTFFMRTESQLVLKGRRVLPKALEDAGFKFKFQNIKEALNSLNM